VPLRSLRARLGNPPEADTLRQVHIAYWDREEEGQGRRDRVSPLEQLIVEFYERWAAAPQTADDYAVFANACFRQLRELEPREMTDAFMRGRQRATKEGVTA